MRKLLKIGPVAPHETRGFCYIALDHAQLNLQIGNDFLVGQECHSMEELEAEVSQIKFDLDEILQQARDRFPGKGRGK